MLGTHNQDPTQNTRRWGEQRAKSAAIVGAISLPAWVALGLGAKPADARPDAVNHNSTPNLISKNYKRPAAPERIQQAEQSTQAFIDSFDKRLAREVKLMHSSQYFTTRKSEEVSKYWHTVITVDNVDVPSRQYPGRYDRLAVLTRKGESVPLTASVIFGSDSNTHPSANFEHGYGFGQVDDAGGLSPKSMMLAQSNNKDHSPADIYYNVSSEGYPAPGLPAVGIKYSDSPAKVAAAYNDFLRQIHDIATRK